MTDRDGRGAGGGNLFEHLEAKFALDGGYELHLGAPMDEGQGNGGELQFVREHGAVRSHEIGQDVHSLGGVGDEGDLVGLGSDETRHPAPDHLDLGQPGFPAVVAAFFEFPLVTGDFLPYPAGGDRSGGRVQVYAVLGPGKILAEVVPIAAHGGVRILPPRGVWEGFTGARAPLQSSICSTVK